jgi:excisionase family DNA binding protein
MMMSDGERLTTTEAARRLGLRPEEIYRLVFAGELEGHPDDDGVVRIDERVIAGYRRRQPRVSRPGPATQTESNFDR